MSVYGDAAGPGVRPPGPPVLRPFRRSTGRSAGQRRAHLAGGQFFSRFAEPSHPRQDQVFDDALERILGEFGVDQLVILAAGMDTRAFRLPLPPDLALFELDRPEVLDLKASRLAQVNAVPGCWRVPLPADLTGRWPATLQGGGFDRQRRSVWLVEGLTPYLTDDQVQHLLGTLSELAIAGSWLLADVIGLSFLTSPRLADFRATMAANGSPFRFGTDDPEGLMRMHGWRPQVSRFDEAGANLARWTLPATYREEPHSPHGYLIVAHR